MAQVGDKRKHQKHPKLTKAQKKALKNEIVQYLKIVQQYILEQAFKEGESSVCQLV